MYIYIISESKGRALRTQPKELFSQIYFKTLRIISEQLWLDFALGMILNCV